MLSSYLFKKRREDESMTNIFHQWMLPNLSLKEVSQGLRRSYTGAVHCAPWHVEPCQLEMVVTEILIELMLFYRVSFYQVDFTTFIDLKQKLYWRTYKILGIDEKMNYDEHNLFSKMNRCIYPIYRLLSQKQLSLVSISTV